MVLIPAQIKLIEKVINKLSKEGTLDRLSEVEKRRLRAVNITRKIVSK